MRQIKLEVIVQSKQEAIEALKLGADRLELVSAMKEGGLTPSYGTMKQVLENVEIPVQIMVRPHSYNFFYTEADFEVIVEDVKAIRELGGNRIVFGALNQDGTVNASMLKELINQFPEIDITFHRAFDEVTSQEEAYQTLCNYPSNVKRILTSGGKPNCMEGKEHLRKLVKLQQELGGPVIMPGSGLTPENIQEIKQTTEATEFHFGKSVRIEQSFANGFDGRSVDGVLRVLKEG
ncbi:copper homeostasis protein CutC [Virgibacillus halodenitrificans]|uniref:copper homeostasis protein CutC n=1 Tax=Virgibacillus halodenitrificans TaxID=1482 RepID=UPI00045C9154|nr:copper homeostasis protein CutC [Virgibacillus halodenitrificans]CDQ31455.1 Copper homeostasis protein CutC [Virgibacillus halodenitrificans]